MGTSGDVRGQPDPRRLAHWRPYALLRRIGDMSGPLVDPEVRAALDLCAELLATLNRIADRQAGAAPPSGAAADLTPREREVLSAMGEGATPSQIALELHISPRTVHKHLEHAYRKLGVTHG